MSEEGRENKNSKNIRIELVLFTICTIFIIGGALLLCLAFVCLINKLIMVLIK